MIRYSIIIPHHNIPDLLERCLKSIPDQDDIQVIVVDDNSDEESTFWHTISTVGHKNVEAVVTKEGRGAGYARNIGLSRAKGKWLVFADADDFFNDGFLQILNLYYEMSEDIAYFNIHSCLCEDLATPCSRDKDFMFECYNQNHDDKLFRFGYTEPWGKMVRRDLVDNHNILFDETKVSNDYLFSVKIGYYAKSVKMVNTPIYVYTVRNGSLTSDDHTVNLEKLTERLDAYIHVQAFMQSVGYYSSPALTSHILVPLFKNYNKLYRSYLRKLREHNLSVLGLIADTLCHYIGKLAGKKRLYGDVYQINWEK